MVAGRGAEDVDSTSSLTLDAFDSACMPVGTVTRYVFPALRQYRCGMHNDIHEVVHCRRC